MGGLTACTYPVRGMNAAELNTIIAILGCPAASGLAAAGEKAGWSTAVFVASGLAVGVGSGKVIHKLSYWLLALGANEKRAWAGWMLMLAYTLIPLALAFCAIFGSGLLTVWLLRHHL